MKTKKTTRVRVTRTGRRLCLAVLLGLSFISCNVTRKLSSSSAYVQDGDTTCVIVTESVESYNANKF